jgi:hypothetical protein
VFWLAWPTLWQVPFQEAMVFAQQCFKVASSALGKEDFCGGRECRWQQIVSCCHQGEKIAKCRSQVADTDETKSCDEETWDRTRLSPAIQYVACLFP